MFHIHLFIRMLCHFSWAIFFISCAVRKSWKCFYRYFIHSRAFRCPRIKEMFPLLAFFMETLEKFAQEGSVPLSIRFFLEIYIFCRLRESHWIKFPFASTKFFPRIFIDLTLCRSHWNGTQDVKSFHMQSSHLSRMIIAHESPGKSLERGSNVSRLNRLIMTHKLIFSSISFLTILLKLHEKELNSRLSHERKSQSTHLSPFSRTSRAHKNHFRRNHFAT